MKVLIDTTYLLPVAGIDVVGLDSDNISSLIASGHTLLVNQVSLFEILGKASSLVSRGGSSRTRIEAGLRSIMNSAELEILPIIDRETVPVALDLIEQGMRDLPDIVIVASALTHADSLITEAKDIRIFLKKRRSKLSVFNLREFISRFPR